MSKTKLLFNLARELRSLADSVQAVAEALADKEPVEAEQTETPVSAKEMEPKAKTVTLEEVRAALADKSQQGFTAEVRALLEKHGATKLSEVDPAEYPALLKEAEALENG